MSSLDQAIERAAKKMAEESRDYYTREEIEEFFNEPHDMNELCLKRVFRQKLTKENRWIVSGNIYYCQMPKNHAGPCCIFIL